MRIVAGLLFGGVVGIMLATCVRNTEWVKERNRKIYETWCVNSGGKPKAMKTWSFECEFKTDDKRKIIKP